MSFFSHVQLESIDVFALYKRFYQDNSDIKINLVIGGYRDHDGKPWTLPVVRIVEKILASDETLNKEYLPVLGLEDFTDAATKWLLGENSPVIGENRCSIGTVYLTASTLGSHKLLFENGGFTAARKYRYWSEETQSLDFEGLIEDLGNAPEGSVIILHACAHNPSGCDLDEEQWCQIAEVMKEKRLFPFFDAALQGFASGNLLRDAAAVRFFVDEGFELFCAQSFSKNFGLYSERIGNLVIILNNPKLVAQVKSQFTLIIRGMYSNPPSHGARIVSYVLKHSHLYNQWQEHVNTMFSRICEMRKKLREVLEQLGTPGDWSHITRQTGMVCSTGLTETQCEYLISKYHIYILSSGRFNICSVTPLNVDYIAKAIYETIIYVSHQ